MAEEKYYSFKDGMPTGPDVAALQKAFPDLKIGDTVSYEAVSGVIGCPWTSARFKTITTVWRRRLMESGLVLGCDPGESFRVLTASQISAKTYSTLEEIGRKAKKQRKREATIRPKDDAERAGTMHRMRLLSAIEQDSKKSRMNILPPTEIKPAPRISPPDQKAGASEGK